MAGIQNFSGLMKTDAEAIPNANAVRIFNRRNVYTNTCFKGSSI
jgi:hypothetical protein